MSQSSTRSFPGSSSVTKSTRRRGFFRRDRKHEIGAGHPFKLALEDRLLMLLMYYRTYVTSIFLGFVFDLDQSNVLKDIRMLEPLVKECIPLPEKLHEMARRARTFEEVERYFPGFKAFVDATEQEIPRPKDATKRKTHYSGKRKKHTVKTQLTVNSEGLIVHRTDHARGRRNDLEIYTKRHPDLPKEVEQGFDRGYHGVKNYFPDLNCAIPFKKKSVGRGHRGEKAKDLTPEQKAFNKKLSKAQGRGGAHHIEGEEVQHLRDRVQEQAQELRRDDRHRVRPDKLQDTRSVENLP